MSSNPLSRLGCESPLSSRLTIFTSAKYNSTNTMNLSVLALLSILASAASGASVEDTYIAEGKASVLIQQSKKYTT